MHNYELFANLVNASYTDMFVTIESRDDLDTNPAYSQTVGIHH
jgi:hypothetical protein